MADIEKTPSYRYSLMANDADEVATPAPMIGSAPDAWDTPAGNAAAIIRFTAWNIARFDGYARQDRGNSTLPKPKKRKIRHFPKC